MGRGTWCVSCPNLASQVLGMAVRELPKEGVLYVGTKATMRVGGLEDGIRILNSALNEKAKTIPRTLPRRRA